MHMSYRNSLAFADTSVRPLFFVGCIDQSLSFLFCIFVVFVFILYRVLNDAFVSGLSILIAPSVFFNVYLHNFDV